MKKIALLLVFVILASFIAGCSGDGDTSSTAESLAGTSSADASSDASSDDDSSDVNTSDDSSDDSSDAPEPIEPQYATVISVGKPYNNPSSTAEYPDSYNTELTDGIIVEEGETNYGEAKFAGYSDDVVEITLDLGEVYEKIYQFKLGFLSTYDAGISPPGAVNVYISEDGENYTDLKYCQMPSFKNNTRQEAVLTLEQYVTARYVRYTVYSGAAWVFVDEVTVIADVEDSGEEINQAFLEAIKNAYQTLGTVSYTGSLAPDTSKALQLVSKGRGYTAKVSADSGFPDGGKYLTDGNITKYFEGGKWVGYKGGKEVAIIVDLGKNCDNLSIFKTVCFSNPNIGIGLPVAVTYAVSDDKKEFTDVGRVFGIASGQNVYDYPLYLDQCASGRYVRVTLEATDTKLHLLEEIAVYAHTGVEEQVGLYPDLVFDDSVITWPSPSNDLVNLISGLTQQISCPADVDSSTINNNSKVTSKLMTDGKRATNNNIHSGKFFKFNGGGSREIYYDFGATSTVKSITAEFTHVSDWAVHAPSTILIKLSMDGKTWYNAGTATTKIEGDQIVFVEYALEKPVQARYICFNFAVAMWAGISELEVFGTTATNGVPTLEESGYPKYNQQGNGNQPPKADVLNGASDLVLLYHGPKAESYTVENLIPYLAYVDTEGNIKDTMFDSYLFLLTGSFPSGAAGHGASTMSDWKWSINDMFKKDKNVLALEEAAGIVKEALKLPDDYKYTFTVTLYYPHHDVTAFGDIDGDGKAESFKNNNENRLKAVEWYMDEFEKKLGEYNFKNIEFVGYYCYNESIYPEGDQPYIVTETAKLVHERGYSYFWIPYFAASSFQIWDSFGFDVACMQPNYVFAEETPYSRIEQTAYFTQLYGMGVEIEISGAAFKSDIIYKKYLEYLSGGVKYGYMKDCVHMYYQDLLCYYDAAVSKDPKNRLIYDYTYQFIKGTLNAYPEAKDEIKVNAQKNTVYTGSITENPPSHMVFELVGSPEHGSVSVHSDGTFTFYPEKDFTGTVTFEYVYDEGLLDSEPCTVTITVE